jgi:uncharacterized membrane protein YqjE
MLPDQRDIRVDRGNGRVYTGPPPASEPSLGELFGRLSSDAGRLVHSEVALAKAELRDAASRVARDGAKIGMAVGLAHVGLLSATAFLIIGLGTLLNNYWASALIVTIVLLGSAAFLGKSAVNDLKDHGVKPQETLDTLREDADWAKREAQALKRDLTSKNPH